MGVDFMKFEKFRDILLMAQPDFAPFQPYHAVWGGVDLMVNQWQAISDLMLR